MRQDQNVLSGVTPSPVRLLLLIITMAVAFRLAWLTLFAEAINGEGAEYARIAENILAGNGYTGIATDGLELMFPPLFPFLIAGVSLVTGSAYLAAQVVAMVAGVILLLAIFGIARTLYGNAVAFVAVGVAALHPVLIKLSGTTWVEGLYIALVMASVYFMNLARCVASYRPWALAGATAGLAYLTSPQALLFPLFFLASQLVSRHSRGTVTLGRTAFLFGSFMLLATPYVAFLSSATGALRVEGKTIVNNELGRRILEGTSYCEAGYKVTEKLEAEGVWMRSNAQVAQLGGPPNYGLTFSIMAEKGFRNIATVARAYWTTPALGAPMVGLLVILGLLRSAWTPSRANGERLLMFSVLCGLAPLMTPIHAFQERYYFFIIPFLVIWAAKGISEIVMWCRETLTALSTKLPWVRVGSVIGGALAFFGLITPMAIGFNDTPTFWEDSGAKATAIREAGRWLANVSGEKMIMVTDTPIAFHASARYLPMPCTDSDTALRFAEQRKVDYIVLLSWTVADRPYLQDWMSTGIPSPNAKLVYSVTAGENMGIQVYRFDRAELSVRETLNKHRL